MTFYYPTKHNPQAQTRNPRYLARNKFKFPPQRRNNKIINEPFRTGGLIQAVAARSMDEAIIYISLYLYTHIYTYSHWLYIAIIYIHTRSMRRKYNAAGCAFKVAAVAPTAHDVVSAELSSRNLLICRLSRGKGSAVGELSGIVVAPGCFIEGLGECIQLKNRLEFAVERLKIKRGRCNGGQKFIYRLMVTTHLRL